MERISNLTFVRLETTRFSRVEAVCHTSRRYFSDSGNKKFNRVMTFKIVLINKINYLKEGCTKWIGEMLIQLCDIIELISFLLLIKLRKLRKKFLTQVRKFLRICFIAPYRWMNRIIRKLFQSMRRILKYRVPLGYILLVNFLSIQVGLYTWVAFLREDQMNGDTIQNFINYYPILETHKHIVDPVNTDQIEFITQHIVDPVNIDQFEFMTRYIFYTWHGLPATLGFILL